MPCCFSAWTTSWCVTVLRCAWLVYTTASRMTFSIKVFKTERVSSYTRPEICLTPPLRASLRIPGLEIPCPKTSSSQCVGDCVHDTNWEYSYLHRVLQNRLFPALRSSLSKSTRHIVCNGLVTWLKNALLSFESFFLLEWGAKKKRMTTWRPLR
jgi:hypothetical protein